jgi:hypothetical protein
MFGGSNSGLADRDFGQSTANHVYTVYNCMPWKNWLSTIFSYGNPSAHFLDILERKPYCGFAD